LFQELIDTRKPLTWLPETMFKSNIELSLLSFTPPPFNFSPLSAHQFSRCHLRSRCHCSAVFCLWHKLTFSTEFWATKGYRRCCIARKW